MAKQVKQETTKTTSFKMEQAFALWKNKGKNGKAYFTGGKLIAFYNTMKKNPKEPDLRVYKQTEKGVELGEPITSLWCNISKGGKKYLSGKYDGKKVVGFINEKATEKQPYISVYYSNSEPAKVEQTTLVPDTTYSVDAGDEPF